MNTPNPNQPHASLVVDSTAKSLQNLGYELQPTSDILVIQAVGGDVRFTVNGNAPTAASGLLISEGESIQIGQVEILTILFIVGSGSPKLEIAAYVQ